MTPSGLSHWDHAECHAEVSEEAKGGGTTVSTDHRGGHGRGGIVCKGCGSSCASKRLRALVGGQRVVDEARKIADA